MQVRSLFALLAATLGSSALAQNGTLTIGDPAPAFKVEGWAKGDKIDKLERGKVYVIEFWATWCGPCVSAMPHLSELAEKFGKKATIISINTWDYKAEGVAEAPDSHQKRVKHWIAGNDKNMRYNIAYDDANDTMANTWMRPAGRNGIPCAMIVNEGGKIAWIGHPMSMDDPLNQIVEKKWDLAAAKAKYDKDMEASRTAGAKLKDMMAAAKAADMAKFEKLMGTEYASGISAAINGNVDFGMSVLEKYADKATQFPVTAFLSMAGYVAQNTKSDDVRARALKFSTDRIGKEGDGPVETIYHARVLFYAGQKDEAMKWADKASGMLDKIKDESQRESIKKLIESSKATFAKPAGGGSGG